MDTPKSERMRLSIADSLDGERPRESTIVISKSNSNSNTNSHSNEDSNSNRA